MFGLIDRFSEDIDISIDRAALGFSGERDLANPPLSGTKRKALDEELRAAITAEVNSDILPKLHERFQAILGKHGWELAPSKDENEEMTLLFHYPNAFEYSKYLRPQIKIEFGRGDQQPSEKSSVTPLRRRNVPRYVSREVRCDCSSSIVNAHSGRKSRSYMPRIIVPIQPN